MQTQFEQQLGYRIGNLSLSYWLALGGLFIFALEALVGGIMEDNMVILAVTSLLSGITGIILNITNIFIVTILMIIYGSISFYFYNNYTIFGQRGESTTEADSLIGQRGIVKKTVTVDEGLVKLYEGGFDPNYSAIPVGGSKIEEGKEVEVIEGGNVLKVKVTEEE